MPSFVSWVQPPSGSHPRIWINPSSGFPNYAPTISQIQARAGSTHANQWQFLKNYCSGATGKSIDYFKRENFENLAALAFAYLIDNSLTAYADKARDIALLMAAEAPGASVVQRRQMLIGMACVYDWLYHYIEFTNANKVTIRNALGNAGASGWIDSFRDLSGEEYTWGHDHGDVMASAMGLMAIMEDSNLHGGSGNPENSIWRSWMDTIMNGYDNGTDASNYFALFRYFAKDSGGNVVGGTYKGSGQFSYWTRNQEFYAALMPAFKSALNVPFLTQEPWWNNQLWDLWHWRGDRTFHRQGDHMGQNKYHPHSHAHTYMTSNYLAGVDANMARNVAWLSYDMARTTNQVSQAIWGPYYMYRLLHENPTVQTSTRPTIASMGGNQMKYFERVGKIVFRDGWEETSTSVTISAPRFFLGGHQVRDIGHWELCTQGSPIFISNGHYDGNETVTYKTLPSSTPPTGHRYTYMKNACAFNVLRIHNSFEPSVNPYDSFQLDDGSGAGDVIKRFGTKSGSNPIVISNYGGHLWPKNTTSPAGGTNFQPVDLTELLATTAWQFSTFPTAPVENSQFCYAVTDLKPWFWATKCMRHKRHFLWVKRGAIPGWDFPILMIFDDVIATYDATFDKRTCVMQLQSNNDPSGNGNFLSFIQGTTAKAYYRALKPTGLEMKLVDGYRDGNNVVYDPSKTHKYDDSIWPENQAKPYRTEINPPTFDGNLQLCYFIFPCTQTTASHPAITLIDDATWIGGNFTASGIQVKVRKGDAFEAMVMTTPGPPPPVLPPPTAPTGLVAVAGDAKVQLDWADNIEPSVTGYKVYRQQKIAGVYQAQVLLTTTTASDYLETGMANGLTFRYNVSAVNTTPQEGAQSAPSSDVTPSAPLPPPPPPPAPGASTNTQRRSLPQSMSGFTLPVPDSTINVANRVHLCFLNSLVVPQGPPVDISIGDPLECDGTPLAGVTILKPAPLAGATITTSTPIAGNTIPTQGT